MVETNGSINLHLARVGLFNILLRETLEVSGDFARSGGH